MNRDTDKNVTPEPLESASPDLVAERLDVLRSLIPEVFSEGRVDWEKLRVALGANVDGGPERYGLTWFGKREAMQAVQVTSNATLVPEPEKSLNFDTAQNVIIEGDNLEVLKLLQRGYLNKVKLIYIDPPYNTGKDFVYPDNFRDSLKAYLELTGQAGDGVRWSTNSDSGGRYHSRWLSMMWPRLFLARNLLSEKGAIFISIDDVEFANLREVLDEIFGAENFIGTVIWQKVFSPKNTTSGFSVDHDYVVVYARDAEEWKPALLPRSDEMDARYSNPDNDPRGVWTSGDLAARNYYGEGTYPITTPSGRVIEGPTKGTYWRVNREKLKLLDADGRIWWGDDGDNKPRIKRFLSEVRQGVVPQTLWKHEDVGNTQEAKKELLAAVDFEDSDSVFETPKPTRMLERILQIGTDKGENDLVMDFFAGSGAFGDAVLKANARDGGNRRVVLVQVPEPIGKVTPATVAEVTRLRMVAAIKSLKQSAGELLPKAPNGFRYLRLAESNFRVWRGENFTRDAMALAEQIQLFAEHKIQGTSEQAVLYEILLKSGFELTVDVLAEEIEGMRVYLIAGGLLAVSLDVPLRAEPLRALAARSPKPSKLVVLDAGFRGNDQLRTNLALEMRTAGIEFRTV